MDLGPHSGSARGLQLQGCPCLSMDPVSWCPTLTLDLAHDREAVSNPGLQNGFLACPQTCLITMNLPDRPQAAPSLPCSLAGAAGLVPAARLCPASPGEPLQLSNSPALGRCLPATRGPAWPLPQPMHQPSSTWHEQESVSTTTIMNPSLHTACERERETESAALTYGFRLPDQKRKS